MLYLREKAQDRLHIVPHPRVRTGDGHAGAAESCLLRCERFILLVGGDLTIAGTIDCSGGRIFVCCQGTISNTGTLKACGGAGCLPAVRRACGRHGDGVQNTMWRTTTQKHVCTTAARSSTSTWRRMRKPGNGRSSTTPRRTYDHKSNARPTLFRGIFAPVSVGYIGCRHKKSA